MNRFVIQIFLFGAVCVGISQSGVTRAEAIDAHRIQVGAAERTYQLFVPEPRPSSKVPLVILLHGNGGSAEQLLGQTRRKAPYTNWLSIARRENFIVVVPNGLAGPNGKSGWNDCRKDAFNNSTADDVGFVRKLIGDLAVRYPVDTSRVFATGTSNGGHMSIRLAIALPAQIAAVAPVVAAMPRNSQCSSAAKPVPILFMNGTEDPLLPFAGGVIAKRLRRGRGEALSAQQSVDWWVRNNRAVSKPVVSAVNDANSRDSSTVREFCYPATPGGAAVVLYQVDGGGHTEPSINERYSRLFKRFVGNQNADMEMAEVVWSFFSQPGQCGVTSRRN